MPRLWLLLGTVINAIVFLPAAYMAANAFDIARRNDFEPYPLGIAMLFIALPVFCLAAPFAAWRAQARRAFSAHTSILLAAPLLYATFLIVFLYSV